MEERTGIKRSGGEHQMRRRQRAGGRRGVAAADIDLQGSEVGAALLPKL